MNTSGSQSARASPSKSAAVNGSGGGGRGVSNAYIPGGIAGALTGGLLYVPAGSGPSTGSGAQVQRPRHSSRRQGRHGGNGHSMAVALPPPLLPHPSSSTPPSGKLPSPLHPGALGAVLGGKALLPSSSVGSSRLTNSTNGGPSTNSNISNISSTGGGNGGGGGGSGGGAEAPTQAAAVNPVPPGATSAEAQSGKPLAVKETAVEHGDGAATMAVAAPPSVAPSDVITQPTGSRNSPCTRSTPPAASTPSSKAPAASSDEVPSREPKQAQSPVEAAPPAAPVLTSLEQSPPRKLATSPENQGGAGGAAVEPTSIPGAAVRAGGLTLSESWTPVSANGVSSSRQGSSPSASAAAGPAASDPATQGQVVNPAASPAPRRDSNTSVSVEAPEVPPVATGKLGDQGATVTWRDATVAGPPPPKAAAESTLTPALQSGQPAAARSTSLATEADRGTASKLGSSTGTLTSATGARITTATLGMPSYLTGNSSKTVPLGAGHSVGATLRGSISILSNARQSITDTASQSGAGGGVPCPPSWANSVASRVGGSAAQTTPPSPLPAARVKGHTTSPNAMLSRPGALSPVPRRGGGVKVPPPNPPPVSPEQLQKHQLHLGQHMKPSLLPESASQSGVIGDKRTSLSSENGHTQPPPPPSIHGENRVGGTTGPMDQAACVASAEGNLGGSHTIYSPLLRSAPTALGRSGHDSTTAAAEGLSTSSQHPSLLTASHTRVVSSSATEKIGPHGVAQRSLNSATPNGPMPDHQRTQASRVGADGYLDGPSYVSANQSIVSQMSSVTRAIGRQSLGSATMFQITTGKQRGQRGGSVDLRQMSLSTEQIRQAVARSRVLVEQENENSTTRRIAAGGGSTMLAAKQLEHADGQGGSGGTTPKAQMDFERARADSRSSQTAAVGGTRRAEALRRLNSSTSLISLLGPWNQDRESGKPPVGGSRSVALVSMVDTEGNYDAGNSSLAARNAAQVGVAAMAMAVPSNLRYSLKRSSATSRASGSSRTFGGAPNRILGSLQESFTSSGGPNPSSVRRLSMQAAQYHDKGAFVVQVNGHGSDAQGPNAMVCNPLDSTAVVAEQLAYGSNSGNDHGHPPRPPRSSIQEARQWVSGADDDAALNTRLESHRNPLEGCSKQSLEVRMECDTPEASIHASRSKLREEEEDVKMMDAHMLKHQDRGLAQIHASAVPSETSRSSGSNAIQPNQTTVLPMQPPPSPHPVPEAAQTPCDPYAGEAYRSDAVYEGAWIESEEMSTPGEEQGGGPEWLQIPILFYLVALLIRLHEFNADGVGARGGSSLVDSNGDHLDDLDVTKIEEEAHMREAREKHLLRIGQAVYEVDRILLNPLLTKWSDAYLFKTLKVMADAWKKYGQSPQFHAASLDALSLVSSEHRGQVRHTYLHTVWRFLGQGNNFHYLKWFYSISAVVAVASVVVLNVLHHIPAVVITLSVVLGVMALLLIVIGALVGYHNASVDGFASLFEDDIYESLAQSLNEDEVNAQERHQYLMDSPHQLGDEEDGEKIEGNDMRHRMMDNRSRLSARGELPYDEGDSGGQFHLYVGGLRDPTAASARYGVDQYGNPIDGPTYSSSPRVKEGVSLPADARRQADGSRPLERQVADLEVSKYDSVVTNGVSFQQHQLRLDEGQLNRIIRRARGSIDGYPSTREVGSFAEASLRSDDMPGAGGSVHDSWSSSATHSYHSGNLQGREDVVEGACGDCESPSSQRRRRDQRRHHQPLQKTPHGPDAASDRRSADTLNSQMLQSRLVDEDSEENTSSVLSPRTASPTRDSERYSSGDGSGYPGSNVREEIAHDSLKGITITALIYSRSSNCDSILKALWMRNFLVLQQHSLRKLNAAYHRGSERFKVLLLDACDLLESPADLEMARSWVESRRPVFFFAPPGMEIPADIPHRFWVDIPLQSTDVDTIMYAGAGIDEGLASFTLMPETGPFVVPAYTLGRRLGGGAFGNVFEAELEGSGAHCAVKRMYIKTEEEDGGNQLQDIAREVEIMGSLSHPNIVRYLFSERDGNCVSIFMELCNDGSLSSIIARRTLTNAVESKRILREIISAVVYLHGKRIVHRDLKPDNVLFRDGHVKLSDFGTAVLKRGALRNVKGTFGYMAPEVLVGEAYGKACDVWSIGCIAAEVLFVSLPHRLLNLPELCDVYNEMGPHASLEMECDEELVRSFLLLCLQRDPNKRCTAAGLLSHPMLHPDEPATQRWLTAQQERLMREQSRQRNGCGGGMNRLGGTCEAGGRGGPGRGGIDHQQHRVTMSGSFFSLQQLNNGGDEMNSRIEGQHQHGTQGQQQTHGDWDDSRNGESLTNGTAAATRISALPGSDATEAAARSTDSTAAPNDEMQRTERDSWDESSSSPIPHRLSNGHHVGGSTSMGTAAWEGS